LFPLEAAGTGEDVAAFCAGLGAGTSLFSPGATTLPLVSTGVSMMAFGPGTVGILVDGRVSIMGDGTSGEAAAGGDSA
jgi:hypothetical protein